MQVCCSQCVFESSRDPAQAEAKQLQAANGELSARLATAQQRLELAVARSGAAAAARQLPAAGSGERQPSPEGTSGGADPPEGGGGGEVKRARARQQLFMQSAPATPNQPPRRPPLRAPKGGAPSRCIAAASLAGV